MPEAIGNGQEPCTNLFHYMTAENPMVCVLVEGYTNNSIKRQIHLNVAKAHSEYQQLKSPALKLFTVDYKH